MLASINKRVSTLLSAAIVVLALIGALPAVATPPATLHYQGFLTTATGLPLNSPMTAIRFAIYNQAGTELYAESAVIPVTNGQFSATIGNQVPLTLPFDQPYLLGIKVAGDPEMTPRLPIASSAYAFRASNGGSGGGSVTSVATGPGLTGGPITGSGTIGLAATNLLPAAACATNQIPKWNGAAWACAADASIPAPPATFNNVLVADTGAVSWSSSPVVNNLTVAFDLNLTQSSAFKMEGITTSFMHISGGPSNFFIGAGAGSLTQVGLGNSGVGSNALQAVSIGSDNTAFGKGALFSNSTGSRNIGIGLNGGANLTIGNDNIAIGNQGVVGESGTIRIGVAPSHTRAFVAGINGVAVASGREVLIDSAGQLGTGSRIQRGETSVGGGVAGVNVYTVNFPVAFSVAPRVMVTPKFDLFGGNEINDTVAVTVRAVSTTQFKANVYRVDQAGGAWSANLRLEWQAWE